MPTRRAKTERCATCKYWDGERKFWVDKNGIEKYTLKENAVGTCHGRGNFNGQERMEYSTCVCYSKN